MQDVRFALRSLRRHPGFALLGVAIMALAVGANTAVFSVVHAVLLNPLPYPDPGRIVTFSYLMTGGAAAGDVSRQVSVPDFEDWRARSSTFAAMGYYATRPLSVVAGSAAEYAVVTRITDGFLPALGVSPRHGRSFTQDEAREGAGAALVTDRYARQRVTTMNARLAEHVATPRFRAWLLSLFAGVALCLAMAGVYGVMAYVAAQRSKEMAVRMALGASPRGVLWAMVGGALRLTAVGLALGVLGAAGFTRLFRGMLFAVDAGDVTTYVGVIGSLAFLSLLAAYVPARRCTRIDPIRALRAE